MKYAKIMRQNFIDFLHTRAPDDLMSLYSYAWNEDGSFGTDGVVFWTFDDMTQGDIGEFFEFVIDIVESGHDITGDEDTYYTYTKYGYKIANENALYDIENITKLADWLIDSVWYCFPSWTFCNMVDVDDVNAIERYCRIISEHI